MGTTKRAAAVFTLLAVSLIATLLALSGCLDTGIKYTVKYFASEGGEIAGNPRQTIKDGSDTLTVTAQPSEGYEFDEWSDGNKTAARTDKANGADFEVTAQFKFVGYSVKYFTDGKGDIIGEAHQLVNYDENAAEVTVVAKQGYLFAGWSDGVMTATRQDNNITGNFQVNAIFKKNIYYNVSYITYGSGEIVGQKEQWVLEGEAAEEVTAMPRSGAKFVGWSDGVTTQTRQDKNITERKFYIARFEMIRYYAKYNATEGGRIGGRANDLFDPYTFTQAYPIPEEAYEFVKWSDGVMTEERRDLITADFEVTAIFKRKEFAVKYTPQKGGGISGQQEQSVLYGSASNAVTAKPDAGYEFLSWSDGIMTPTRQDSEVKNNVDVRATFAPINGVEYRVLMVYVTELHAELLSNDDEIIKVDYIMTEVEREILKVVTRKLAGCLNDIFEGDVKFLLDNYFTTQPLGKENLYRGMDGLVNTYGIETRLIPEIQGLLKNYGSTMITFSMNDFEKKLHCIGGGGKKKEAFIHMESLLYGSIANGDPLENLLEETSVWWESTTGHYLHEFIHTVEQQLSLGYSLHTAIIYYSMEQKIKQLEVMKLYIRRLAFVNNEYIGVTEIFWKEWHDNNPRITI